MKKIAVILVLLVTTFVAFGQIPKPLKNTYVNDFARVLTTQQIKDLNQQISAVEKSTGVQLAVVLVKKIPAQYDIKDYTLLIGRKWHVGNQKTGLVYVAAINQRKQRLEVARNLDSIFNNAKSTDILSSMKEDYAAKNYYAGLQTLVSRLNTELAPLAIQNTQPVPQAQKPVVANDSNDTMNIIIGVIAVVGIFVLFIFLLGYSATRRRNAVVYNNGVYPNQPGYGVGYPQQGLGSGVGSFATGAIVGAAAGYAIRSAQDHMSNNTVIHDHYTSSSDPDYSSSDTSDSSSFGDWGSSDSSSSSDSYDSGFSDSDSSSDSGATTDW